MKRALYLGLTLLRVCVGCGLVLTFIMLSERSLAQRDILRFVSADGRYLSIESAARAIGPIPPRR